MTLPNQPVDMTMTMVAAEIGATPPLSLGDSRVRTLAGKPSGPIRMSDLRGKSAYTPPSIICDLSVQGHVMAMHGEMAYAGADFFFQINGGEAPFNVVWTRVGGVNVVTVTGGASPFASADGTAPFSYSAVFRATVTDARSNQATSPDISIQLSAGQDIS